MPFNFFKKKIKDDRNRSNSSSSPGDLKQERTFNRSLSVGSIFEKFGKYDTIDEGDSPIDYDPSGAVTFIVKQKLFESRGEIVQRKLVINVSGLHFVDITNGTVYEEYKFEKIKAFFYAEDNSFVVLSVSKNDKEENVVFKASRQANKVKEVVESTIERRVREERQKMNGNRPAPPINSQASSSAPNLSSMMTSIPRPASKVQYNTSTDFFEEGNSPKLSTFTLSNTNSRLSHLNPNPNRSLSMTDLPRQQTPKTSNMDLISFDD